MSALAFAPKEIKGEHGKDSRTLSVRLSPSEIAEFRAAVDVYCIGRPPVRPASVLRWLVVRFVKEQKLR